MIRAKKRKPHGTQVMEAVARIRNKHDIPARNVPDASLLTLIADREDLKPPVSLLIADICAKLKPATARTPPQTFFASSALQRSKRFNIFCLSVAGPCWHTSSRLKKSSSQYRPSSHLFSFTSAAVTASIW